MCAQPKDLPSGPAKGFPHPHGGRLNGNAGTILWSAPRSCRRRRLAAAPSSVGVEKPGVDCHPDRTYAVAPRVKLGVGEISTHGIARDTQLCFSPAHSGEILFFSSRTKARIARPMWSLRPSRAHLRPLDGAVLLQSPVVLLDRPRQGSRTGAALSRASSRRS